MKLTFDTLGFDFEFEPGKAYSPRGELTATTKDQSFGQSIDLKAAKSRNEFADEFALLYPDELEDVLELKRALGELYLHVKDELAIAKLKAEEADEEESEEAPVEEASDDVLELVRSETVLNDYVEAMAEVHEVAGDRHYMKLITLGALSAQLAPLPTGTVLGANVILTADSGRGKNFLCDAVASGLPAGWVYAFESASPKAFYYKASADPECFKHTWAYPNEAEATDMLVETLRPLLSSGHARHDTVDSGDDGANEARSLTIEGPITCVIPTVRNKLDGQLQTRMLVVDVADYEGRVQEHTAAFSKTLWASHAVDDQASMIDNWRSALGTLAGVRRVVLPVEDEDFKLTANIPHGARLWRNFCSLMLTNAWLQQHRRTVTTLENGERAVVVSADDYRVAYEVFKDAATRSLDNIGEKHVKILNALYELQTNDSRRVRDKGFSLRKIADKAGASINHELIRTQKGFLMNLGFVIEDDRGSLRLIEGVEPSAWGAGKSLNGFPDPDEITKRWAALKTPDKPDREMGSAQKPIGIEDSLSGEKTGVTPKEKPIGKPSKNGGGQVSGLSEENEPPGKSLLSASESGKGETELGSYRNL